MIGNIFPDELVINVEVEYTVISKGRPATGPTYSCGGQPAEPPEIELTVRFNGCDITEYLSDAQLEELQDKAFEDLDERSDEGPEYCAEGY